MASSARRSFDKNVKDVERLLEIHSSIGGTTKGRKWNVEVLNKSAIVLITAHWEAYCEDVASDGIAQLVKHAKNVDVLPHSLKTLIASELKKAPHDHEVWKLAGDGWKKILTDRFASMKVERERRMNTPKTAQINQLFYITLGIENISDNWKWARMPNEKATARLDKFVELRGAIAHRGQHSEGVTKAQVEHYLGLVKDLVRLTGGAVHRHLKSATGVGLWRIVIKR